MRNVFLIVRRELAAYVRTPSGYMIAAAVLLLDGLAFNVFAVSDRPQLSTEVLQNFLYLSAITTEIAGILFTMRMLAEERANGTQVLLFTSPVHEGEIVVGKFLAGFTFLTILTLLTLYCPALIFVNGKVSLGHIAAGYIGLILLGAATLSLGMFASSLVKQPFLAVILVAVFILAIELCYPAAKKTDPPFTELVGFVPLIGKHYHAFRRGLIQLSDVVYFCSIIYLSLFAATQVLKSQRWQ